MAYILLVKYKFKLLTPHFFIVSYKISKNSACLQTVDKTVQKCSKELWIHCIPTHCHKHNKNELTIKQCTYLSICICCDFGVNIPV